MGMVLKILSESGCLHVKASGKFSLAEAKRTFLEVLEAAEQYRVDKVLFDGQGLKGNPETIERFYYGAFAARTVVEFAVRNRCASPEFAYVLQPPVLDPERFGETVAMNRGMHVKTFDNLNDAREWLNMASAKPPDTGDGTEVSISSALPKCTFMRRKPQ